MFNKTVPDRLCAGFANNQFANPNSYQWYQNLFQVQHATTSCSLSKTISNELGNAFGDGGIFTWEYFCKNIPSQSPPHVKPIVTYGTGETVFHISCFFDFPNSVAFYELIHILRVQYPTRSIGVCGQIRAYWVSIRLKDTIVGRLARPSSTCPECLSGLRPEPSQGPPV